MEAQQKPQRGLTGVASHFNGWVKEVKGKRAFRYATISGCVSRTYGTPDAPILVHQPLKWLATSV